MHVLLFVWLFLGFARIGIRRSVEKSGNLWTGASLERMQYTQGFSNSRALSAVSSDGCKILYQPLGFSNDGYKLPFKHCCQQKLVGAIGPFSKSMGVIASITLPKWRQPWYLFTCTQILRERNMNDMICAQRYKLENLLEIKYIALKAFDSKQRPLMWKSYSGIVYSINFCQSTPIMCSLKLNCTDWNQSTRTCIFEEPLIIWQ